MMSLVNIQSILDRNLARLESIYYNLTIMEKNSPKIINIRFESSDKDKFFDIVENLLKKNEHCSLQDLIDILQNLKVL